MKPMTPPANASPPGAAMPSPRRFSRNLPRLTFACLASLVLLSACAVGPDYQRPAVAMPTQFTELEGWTQAKPDAEGPKGEWWKGFHDPLLDELMPQVEVSNQTVRQSYANYQQALAEVRVARAGLFPSVGIDGSATRSRGSGSGASTNAALASRGATIVNAASAEGTVSWAPDIWGQVRRTIEQSSTTAQASAATLANATLSEQIALANAVIDLRITDANIALLKQTVDAYTESLRVVADQDRAGTVPPSDVITARTQLENARSSLIALGVSRAQYAHAIAVLVGRNPESLTIAPNNALPTLPDVPIGLPSTLLQRRPDIAVAERQMAAQNAAIGIAVAAYYPNITLSLSDGFSAAPVAGLFKIANYVWSLGASASETIFDAGQRSAKVDAAKAGYDAAVANYRGTVLSALQGVENDLASLRILEQQSQVLDSAVKDAADGARIALNEYQAGTVDYTTVVTATTTQLNTQQSALNVHESRLLAATALIGDLGGGWSDTQLSDNDAPKK
ncbi:Outer membrane protein OprM [Pandoraea pneumonica]|uniref:Outer membrane protein OprM n=2 Tax=Pandoraea pneumonica TaxID=2508299 RepID=A0A5E4SPK5_9BURK|nr:Outer membrane protein OprM [Pandoraea pneumonica]